MLLFLLSGVVGSVLHYRGSREFALEAYPSMTGNEVFWRSIQGAAPILGPGIMIQFGILGLAYTYRHPSLTTASADKSVPQGD
ncbi:MAG: hypothetical protein HYY49_07055 [Ignavibacteriales bacterium]|nr:hypothetical protein [Ignavibacteriales bacterium]